jgi:hypothetical protein
VAEVPRLGCADDIENYVELIGSFCGERGTAALPVLSLLYWAQRETRLPWEKWLAVSIVFNMLLHHAK